MTLSQKTMSGAVGLTKSVTATVTPEGAPQDVSAVSSNDGVATVAKQKDGTFVVTLVASGTANIIFSVGSVSTTLSVTVN